MAILLQTAPAMFALASAITVAFFVFAIVLLYRNLKRCPPNKLLVVFGQGIPDGVSVQHGGARVVWPLLQDYAYLSLEPLSIEMPGSGLNTRDPARVTIQGSVSVAISTKPMFMRAAAERLLGLDERAIGKHIADDVAAATRELVAQLCVEEIYRDRDKFSAELHQLFDERLAKYGVEVVNIRLGDVMDSAGIVEGLEREMASRVKGRAREDAEFKARREREGAALAEKERRKVAEVKDLQQREREQYERSRKAPSDVLKEDPGDALKNM